MKRSKLFKEIEKTMTDSMLRRSAKLIKIFDLLEQNFKFKDKDFGRYCSWYGENISINESRKDKKS